MPHHVGEERDGEHEIVAVGFNKVVSCYRRWIYVMLPKRPDEILQLHKKIVFYMVEIEIILK